MTSKVDLTVLDNLSAFVTGQVDGSGDGTFSTDENVPQGNAWLIDRILIDSDSILAFVCRIYRGVIIPPNQVAIKPALFPFGTGVQNPPIYVGESTNPGVSFDVQGATASATLSFVVHYRLCLINRPTIPVPVGG